MTALTKNSGCACQTAAALSPEIIQKVDEIVGRHKDQAGALMPVLQEVQEAVGYLDPAVQERIAAGLNIPGSEIFGVMSFYSMYTWKPKGRYV
ncbi:MAG: NAD(P)H-dependent oxidoreductase subunit E, partial [Desulfobaccales bacterium]